MKNTHFLAKWLAKEITDEELKQYVSEDEIRLYKKIISTTKNIEIHSYNTEEALEKVKLLHKKQKVKKLNPLKYFYRVAAILTVLFSSYYFISNTKITYNTSFAQKTSFELPDNSNVELNAGSKITYKARSWSSHRALDLEGEAFFSVVKGSKFKVNTSLGVVQVLGTEFNVVARGSYFEVHCYKGLVSVTYLNKIIEVPAGTAFKILNNSTKFKAHVIETNPSWVQNVSSFNSMPYKYVVDEVERQFNIKIKYDSNLRETLFTGNFTHTNLEMALKAISIPLNLKYTIFSNNNVSLHL